MLQGVTRAAGPVLFTGRFVVVTAATMRSGQIWLRLIIRTKMGPINVLL